MDVSPWPGPVGIDPGVSWDISDLHSLVWWTTTQSEGNETVILV